MAEFTAPLANGDGLPDHPANTTARKIVKHKRVYDAEDNTLLKGGLHQNELRMLMAGSQMSLAHLYRYAVLNNHIYHTRKSVVMEVECADDV